MREALAMLRSTLGYLEAERGAERQAIDLFFRDDDVDEDESSLRRLLSIFLGYAIPLNLEIIPGRLTESAAALLRRHHRQCPGLFGIDQHGWLHTNHEPAGRKCEFGPNRSFDQQLADIDLGRRTLESAFGDAFSAVFTPPWNRCTADTFRALDQLGFRILSRKRGEKEVTGYRFREISVTLDLCRWRGGASMKSPEEIAGELSSQIRELDTVGIMLHHKAMDDGAFDLLTLLLDELRSSRAVNFHTFDSLEKAREVWRSLEKSGEV